MKKFEKLSREEMKNVTGGKNTPTCSPVMCSAIGGATGTCGTATESLDTCPCLVNGQWDHVSVCHTI